MLFPMTAVYLAEEPQPTSWQDVVLVAIFALAGIASLYIFEKLGR